MVTSVGRHIHNARIQYADRLPPPSFHSPIIRTSTAAQVLTDQNTDDPFQVGPLLGQVEEKIDKVIADGAHDGVPTYQTIAQYGDDIEMVIPPRTSAVLGTESSLPNQRDRHLDMINTHGRLALVETTMGRY